MKRILILMAVGMLVLGCSAAQPPRPAVEQSHGITEVEHKLKDGLTIRCLIWNPDAGYDAGMSCDWDNPR